MAIKINGVALSAFGGRLLDFSVTGSSYKNGYTMPPRGFFPVRYIGDIGLRDVTLTVDFIGSEWSDAETAASDFIAELVRGADILLPDGFLYYSAFDSDAAFKTPARNIVTHTVKLKAVRHGPLVSDQFSAPATITVTASGNRETPARLYAEGVSGACAVKGISITDLTGEIVIDGIEGKVTRNGQNVFANTNLTTFPRLNPGANTITASGSLTGLTVEYYPLYF